ncbi:helix-turn-helix transcriptional regulator [Halostagnicola kamekurae]|nr:helix-turn-helix transcriptional regulator [Halostagnicola kamekurae]
MTDDHHLIEFNQLSSFERNILFVLAKLGPSKGVVVKNELQNLYDQEINHGRLYPNLDDLVDVGYVDKSERDQRTNEYALTNKAQKALQTQLNWEKKCLEEVDEAEEEDSEALKA